VDEVEELLQLQRRGGAVALAEALREQEPREAPGDRVRDANVWKISSLRSQ